MKIEFKFSNDVIASINLGSQVINSWVYDRHGEVCGYRSIPYYNDNEMVLALKEISEMVNLEQHEDVANCLHDFYNEIEHCSFEGYEDGVMVWSCDNPEKIGLIEALDGTGAVVSDLNEYGNGGLFTSVVVENNGTRIAKIIY
jgi:hypothetical protein